MSRRRDPAAPPRRRSHAPIFAALGDATRLNLIGQLSLGPRRSISQLTRHSNLTRQAITRHLRVLQNAGLVRGQRRGRETLFQFAPAPVLEARQRLALISQQWDQSLSRLKSFVESDPS